MFTIIKNISTGRALKDAIGVREKLDDRIKVLEEATINGEDGWMLEKVKKKDTTKFICSCEEIK